MIKQFFTHYVTLTGGDLQVEVDKVVASKPWWKPWCVIYMQPAIYDLGTMVTIKKRVTLTGI